MNTSIIKYSFLALVLAACDKKDATPPTPAPVQLPPVVERILEKPPARENLLWFPVGEEKTLQTANDILGTEDKDGKLSEVSGTNGKTAFTNPTANPDKTTLTNEYQLTVNLNDIKPSKEDKKGRYLGIRLKVQEGVSYTVLRSVNPTDTKDDMKKGNISFDVVTEAENGSEKNAKAWKDDGNKDDKPLNPNPDFVKYEASKPKHTLVLFNGNGGKEETSNETLKKDEKVTLLLIAEKDNTSQLVKLVLNFVEGEAETKTTSKAAASSADKTTDKEGATKLMLAAITE